MFGAGFDFSPNSEQLATLDAELSVARKQLGLDTEATLPVVVGLLSTLMTIEAFKDNVSPILSKHKPCAIWLFCPVPPTGHAEIISHAHSLGADWGLKAFVQAGTVAAARDAVKDGADIIVAQGVDAGGHQWKNGSGIISIVPEVKDMLKAEFADRQIPVLAAGGIVDGRGVVAALALGESCV